MRHRNGRAIGQFQADLIEGFNQAYAIVACRNKSAGGLEHAREVGSPEIGHAEYTQTACGVIADGVHRHDMTVLKARKICGSLPSGLETLIATSRRPRLISSAR